MKKSKTIQFREKTVAVNELSVDQVAAFLELAADNSSAVPTHALDALMGSIVPFYLVKQCVPELSEEELTQGVGPSELKPLYDAEDVRTGSGNRSRPRHYAAVPDPRIASR